MLFGLIICALIANLAHADYQGFTVTSVSVSDVVTRETSPASVYWIINTQLNGGGQSLTGMISPEQVKNFMGGKLYTRQPFSINVDSVDETVFYEVVNEAVPIYKYTVTTLQDNPTFLGMATGDPSPCQSGTDWDIPLGKTTLQYAKKRYCVKKEQIGLKGAFSNPTINFNAKISLSNGQETREKTICSGAASGCDGSSVSVDEIGVASWTGSLVTGDAAPNQNLFVAIKRFDNNQWQIAPKSYFDAYAPKEYDADSNLNRIKVNLAGTTDIVKGDSDILNAITPVNQAAYALLGQDASFTSTQFSKDSNTGRASVKLQRRLTSPNIVFRIRADWLGIVIPTGKPKIVSVNSDKFVSGESGTAIVQVQNIGDGDGTFSLMLVDCDPFIQTNTAQSARKTLRPNDADSFSISISGGTNADSLSKSCSIRIYDVNDPSLSDTAPISIQQEKAKICVPNQVRAEGNIIKKCNSAGTSLDEIATCQYGLVSDNQGGFACANPPENKEILRDNKPKKKLQCTVDSDCETSSYCNQELHQCIQKSGCINVIESGDPSQKVDIVFIGDGYNDNEELKRDILKIIDFGGMQDGMMAFEPFKTNKNKFNIWMIKAGNKIPSNSVGGPERGASLEVASECTMAEQKVVLSKKNFRSYAYLGDGDAYLSLSGESATAWGRLFLHEFGHSFGKLADEYVEPSKGNWLTGGWTPPNCALDYSTALNKWSAISNTGYFNGCSYVDSNYRPTFNSIMRMHWRDDYGPINRQALEQILSKYG